ncbi:ABC transporter substrate-binding protein [Candidatus Pacearchaeota archaeon]|nr:MAG: ABC transporter substrate-binding protein [Candidatus Pacearchaeota archaeon]
MVCRAIYKILSLWILVNLLTRIVFATTYTFTDKRGEKIIIDIPIKRAVIVISYELIPALDLWNQVVGVSVWAEKDCDIYKAFIKLNPDFKKPTVGAGINLNIETILKLKPDLIITWTYVPQVVNYLESKGFKVFTIHPDNLAEFYQVLRIYGKLFGKEKKAEETIKEMKKIFNLIKRRITNIPPEKRKKILHLGGKPTTVSAGIGITNDLINLIGGINPASVIKKRNVEVSVEKILVWNPDVIFIWGNAGYNENWLFENLQWKHIKAVRMRQVYKLPDWSTWSPRVALVALYMAIKAYPEYFKDIDFEKIADNFYRKIFGISYYYVKKYEKY